MKINMLQQDCDKEFANMYNKEVPTSLLYIIVETTQSEVVIFALARSYSDSLGLSSFPNRLH